MARRYIIPLRGRVTINTNHVNPAAHVILRRWTFVLYRSYWACGAWDIVYATWDIIFVLTYCVTAYRHCWAKTFKNQHYI